MKAVTAEQMQAIEQRSVDHGVSLDALMENAGLAVANAVFDRLGRLERTAPVFKYTPAGEAGKNNEQTGNKPRL